MKSKRPPTRRVALTPQASHLLRRVHATGLYGHTIEQTIDRLVCRQLLELLPTLQLLEAGKP